MQTSILSPPPAVQTGSTLPEQTYVLRRGGWPSFGCSSLREEVNQRQRRPEQQQQLRAVQGEEEDDDQSGWDAIEMTVAPSGSPVAFAVEAAARRGLEDAVEHISDSDAEGGWGREGEAMDEDVVPDSQPPAEATEARVAGWANHSCAWTPAGSAQQRRPLEERDPFQCDGYTPNEGPGTTAGSGPRRSVRLPIITHPTPPLHTFVRGGCYTREAWPRQRATIRTGCDCKGA